MKKLVRKEGEHEMIIDGINNKNIKELKSNIIAYGEATGHQHKFVSGQVSIFKTAYQTDATIVKIDPEYATLSHQQHMPIQIPQGTYEIIRERRYILLQNRLK